MNPHPYHDSQAPFLLASELGTSERGPFSIRKARNLPAFAKFYIFHFGCTKVTIIHKMEP